MVSVEYLAGFIDGEGSLSLSRIPRGQSYREYCVRVTIANTNRAILREIQGDWGGTIHSMGPTHSGWKPGFVLVWTNAAAARLIRRARRYLRIKSQHATALLEFTEHVQKCERRRDELGRLLPLSEDETRVREAFFKRLRGLNRKGVPMSSQGEETPYSDRPGGKVGRISVRYLAGFIDGEGSLMITKSRSRKTGYVQYRPRISVSNTNRGILEEICHQYGGSIHEVGRGKPSWKPAYMLVWTEGPIANVLPMFGLHLRLKRRQAAIQLEFIRHKKDTPRRYKGRFWAPHPRGVIQFRERVYQQMKRLNARGTAQNFPTTPNHPQHA